MTYKITQESDLHRSAAIGVVHLSLESHGGMAKLLDTLRNVFPNVKNYFSEVVLEFKSNDETDFNFQKASMYFSQAEASVVDMNFVKMGHFPVQTPEGFVGRYNPYLEFLSNKGIKYINEAVGHLQAYHTEISRFISSRDAKMLSKDNTRAIAAMEKNLEEMKEELASFFDASTANALKPISALFDRGEDIKQALRKSKDLNRARMGIKSKEVLNLTKDISEMLDLVIEQADSDKLSAISPEAINNLAQGALVAAHFVEFIGVLRYRIEEAVSATCIMSEQVVRITKENK